MMCRKNCNVEDSCRGMIGTKKGRCSQFSLAFVAAALILLNPVSVCVLPADAFSNARPATSRATFSTFRCVNDSEYRKTSVLCASYEYTGGGGGDDDDINNNGRRGGGGGGGGRGGGDSGGNNRDDEHNNDQSSAFVSLDNSKRQGSAIRLFGGGLLSLIFHRGESVLPQTALQLASSAAELSAHRSLVAVTLAYHNQLSNVAKNHFQSAVTSLARSSSSWYMMKLESHPLVTKCVTGGIIGFLGDVGAQCFAHKLEEDSASGNAKTDGGTEDMTNNLPHHSPSMQYDVRRGLSVLAFSMCFSGPILHYSYDLFERLLPVSKMPKGFRTLASSVHVMADALVLDSMFVATNLLVTGLLEGYRLNEDIIPQFKTDFSGTLKTSWGMSAVLAPYQMCCFRFLPASLRVLAVNLSDVAWDGVVSYKNHMARGAASSDVAVESFQ